MTWIQAEFFFLPAGGSRGYVALAVVREGESFTREVETGLGGDREANMVAFAVEALRFVRDVLVQGGDGEGGKGGVVGEGGKDVVVGV